MMIQCYKENHSGSKLSEIKENPTNDCGTTSTSSFFALNHESANAIIDSFDSEEWKDLGLLSASNLSEITEQIFYIILVRVADVLASKDIKNNRKPTHYKKRQWNINTINSIVPKELQEKLFLYVSIILRKYRDVPYHSLNHAFHVVKSANKLLHILLQEGSASDSRSTFGIKSDPLLQFALIFAALIHDVDHQGITNAQLVIEQDELALLHNDKSVAENHSLTVAFCELSSPKYLKLRNAVFEEPDEYRRFRKIVIDLVLCTDIASPERTEIIQSKWKEAFEGKNAIKRVSARGTDTKELCKIDACEYRRARLNSSPIAHSEIYWEESGHGGKRPLLSAFNRARMSICISSTAHNHDCMHKNKLHESEDGFVSLSLSESCDENDVESNDGSNGDILPPVFDVHVKNNLCIDEQCLEKVFTDYFDDTNPSIKEKFIKRRKVSNSCRSDCSNKEVSIGRLAHRRMSAPLLSCGYNERPRPSSQFTLGIRQTLDLSGNTLLSHRPSHMNPAIESGTPNDEADEFRASVVLEHMLKVADISYLLQDWDCLKIWCSRLYYELKDAFSNNRYVGSDPGLNWYKNQIQFLEKYVIPMAARLDECGVFGSSGKQFKLIAEENLQYWILEGKEFSEWMIENWSKKHSTT